MPDMKTLTIGGTTYTIKDARMDSLIDMFYPVGSIYETFDGNFDPNVTWGGTWERIIGRVIIGAFDAGELTTTNQVNTNNDFGETMTDTTSPTTWSLPIEDTGGQYQYKLSAAQSGVPAHTHPDTFTIASGGGAHTHTANYRSVYSGGSNYSAITGSGGTATTTSAIVSSGSHSHTINGSVSNNTAAAASAYHHNVTPYIAANIWRRTA